MPLVFFPVGVEFFEHPKTYFLYSILSLLILLLMPILTKKNHITLYLKATFTKSYLFFLSALITASILGASFSRSIFGTVYRTDGILTFIALLLLAFVLYVLCSENTFLQSKVENAFVRSSVIVAIIAILHFAFVSYIIKNQTTLYDQRAVGTFGQPNFLAGYLLLSIPIFIKVKNTLSNKFIYTYVIAIALALVLSFSKSAIILSILYLLFLYFKNKLSKNDKILVFAATFVLTLMILSGSFSDIHDTFQKNGYYQLQRMSIFLSPKELKNEFRVKIWAIALQAISTRFYTGYGVGNIDVAYYTITKHDPKFDNIIVDSTHNLILDVFLYSGVLGLLGFIIFIYCILIDAWYVSQYYFHVIVLFLLRGLTNITSISMWFILFVLIGITLSQKNLKKLL